MPITFGKIEIAAIFIILFGALVTYISRRLWNKHIRFIKVCDEFSSAFEKTIQILETVPQSNRDILSSEFPIHKKAMVTFRGHLKKGKTLNRFNKTWDKYEQHHREITDVPLLAFLGTEVDDLSKSHNQNHIKEVDERNKNKTLQCIRETLSFAK